MSKLSDAIGKMDQEELMRLKNELDAGSVSKLVNDVLKEKQQEDWNKVCPVCHTAIDESNYTLIFGPEGLRKKASFCATDCLEFFLQKLKAKESHETEVEP